MREVTSLIKGAYAPQEKRGRISTRTTNSLQRYNTYTTAMGFIEFIIKDREIPTQLTTPPLKVRRKLELLAHDAASKLRKQWSLAICKLLGHCLLIARVFWQGKLYRVPEVYDEKRCALQQSDSGLLKSYNLTKEALPKSSDVVVVGAGIHSLIYSIHAKTREIYGEEKGKLNFKYGP